MDFEEIVRPLRIFKEFDADPLNSIAGALSVLEDGETAVFQVLLTRAKAAWTPQILRSVADHEGRSFFVDAPEMLKLAQHKATSSMFAAVVRIAVATAAPKRTWELARTLAGALTQFAAPASNSLIPLTNDDYPDDIHEADFVERQSHRTGMLFNVEELAGLTHLPSSSVKQERLTRHAQRTKKAPQAVAVASHVEA